MTDTSTFSTQQSAYPDAERLPFDGSTCECFCIRKYGKLHFFKQLKAELRTHPCYKAALQKEFETGYRLEHPNLVRYVAHTDDGILMEYVDGETLNSFLTTHPNYFSNKKHLQKFLRQLLDVIGYLHSHQVLHLDLKPDNILITRVGNDVKLIDLGYCYTDTYTDTTGRTDAYAAPEQFEPKAKVDERADIYAIGRILQRLTRARVYKRVADRCTQKLPEDRYQSIDELQVALFHHPRRWRFSAIIAAAILITAGIILTTTNTSTTTTNTSTTTEDKPPQPVSIQEEDKEMASLPHSDDESEQLPIPLSIQQIPLLPSPLPAQGTDKSDVTTTPPQADNTAPQPSNSSKEAPANDKLSDILKLRKELQQITLPLFQKAMGNYNDSAYYHIDLQLWAKRKIAFQNSIFPMLAQMRDKYKSTLSPDMVGKEWWQTMRWLELNQCYRMLSNEPEYEEYKGKTYQYTDPYSLDEYN